MTTQLPAQGEQPLNENRAVGGPQGPVPLQGSMPQPVVLPGQPEAGEESFYFEEEQPDLVESPLVAPFQLSNMMPPVSTQEPPSGQASAIAPEPAPLKKRGKNHQFSFTMIAILVCVIVIAGMLVMNALAQTTPPLQTHSNAMSPATPQPGTSQQKATRKPSPVPTPAHTNGTNGQGQAVQSSPDWVPQQLPDGWTNAGLLTGDALQAMRTAVAFTDREMSLDYRSVGTRNTHGGTFTAATFILTPAARQRFFQDDVREVSNTLFDMVENTKLVRVVIDPQPHLVKFAQQGQQPFAWVNVSFQLWQSQVDPNNPQQRIEGKDIDPATNQPRVHHMMVLLLRVPPQDAGNNPAMGGTGWLVSTYALDPANGALPDVVQPA